MGAMKTILFSFATTETAGPSAEVSVPTRKSTFSLRIISRAIRTASLASAFESRMTSSNFLPRTPPLALISSTNIWAPFEAGSPKSAAGPDSGSGMPTLIVFWAKAAEGMAATSASTRVRSRIMDSSLYRSGASERGQAGSLHPHPVHGSRGGDVQAPIVGIAPGEVGGVLGDVDHAETRGPGVEHVDAAGTAAVEVPRGVDLHAVGGAGALADRLRPHATVREAAARPDVEHADVLTRGVVDEETPLVEREAEAVGTVEIVDEQRRALR